MSPARRRPGGAGTGPHTTVWVLGDQLHPDLGAMATADPATHRILLVESRAKLASKPWHRQRAHLLLTAMHRFAEDRRAEGFEVDHRVAATLEEGWRGHLAEHPGTAVVATEPASWDGLRLLQRLGVTTVRTDQFLCHPDEFAAWAEGRKRLTMEDFYRWQRRRLGYLMDGDQPAGGRWNFDHDNREPPPRDGRAWPAPLVTPLDDLDRRVLASLPATCVGADPDGTWATSRSEARRRLDHAVAEVLPRFGPHEDAMLAGNWHLAHTLLSPYLNIGLLRPREVCDAVEAAYRRGEIPIASAEGFIRQVIGWREYVWGLYWLWMPQYRHENALGAHRPLPPVFTAALTGAPAGPLTDALTGALTGLLTGSPADAPAVPTQMACVASALGSVHDHAWAHHIQRLMVLGNLALLAGVDPGALTTWMWASFVDGAEWVMLPNVIGMALHADGGRMATKPYAAGGAYIDRMSDHCRGCRYDRTRRTGPDACPFTTLYWDFLARHRDRFLRNARVAQQVRAADRLGDLEAVRARAEEVLALLDAGRL